MNIADIENNIAKDDNIERARIGNSRIPRLTFKHLHKLRKIRELKNLEKLNMSRQLELIYGQASSETSQPTF